MTGEVYGFLGATVAAAGGGFGAWVTAQKNAQASSGQVAVDLVKELRSEVESLRQDVDALRQELDSTRQSASLTAMDLRAHMMWCDTGHAGARPTMYSIVSKEI